MPEWILGANLTENGLNLLIFMASIARIDGTPDPPITLLYKVCCPPSEHVGPFRLID